MRVRIDPNTHDPAGEPEFVAGGRMADDFCIDENAGATVMKVFLYHSTKDRQFDRPFKVSMERSDFRIAGCLKGE
jgi:hypothetical protein